MKHVKLGLLVLAVLGVWGTIGYRIVSGLSDETNPIPVVRKSQPERDSVMHYPLSLSYPDPFLSQKVYAIVSEQTKSATQVPKLTAPKENKPTTALVDWNKVEYVGMIQNPDRNVRVATIRIAGQDYFVKEGERVDIFIVSSISKDSIQVSLDDQIKFIKRKI